MLREHLDKRGYDDIEIKELVSLPVGKSDIRNKTLQKALEILGDSYDSEVDVKITSGGSGPYHYVAGRYEIPVFQAGCLYPATKAHAPNENIRVDDYFKAIDVTIDLILNL
jgi:acetylornithine deacetylase/succinyl-diaminopimelate desuccinylase-like protein